VVAPAKKALPRELVNSIGMRFVLVEPGTFLMGSPAGEGYHGPDEYQHEVTITRPFYLGVHPVTQGQWAKVMGTNPNAFSRGGRDKDRVKDVKDADLDLFPVECVSWEDAQAFLKKLATLKEEAKLGRQYRLPTEAEWEYACRGGHLIKANIGQKHTLPFHLAQPSSSLHSSQANFDGNFPDPDGADKGPYLKRPSKVGSYPGNALGIFDMHGNVGEWCLDWYDASSYKTTPRVDPPGPSKGTFRAHRGGSWSGTAGRCRCAYRSKFTPGDRRHDLGFRAAVVPTSGS
jgi:formylglycine-generating enzyme required for sulfatase activity